MKNRVSAGWLYAAAIVALALVVLRSFLPSLVIACVTAVASWPLYRRFATRAHRALGRSGASLVFTAFMTVFVLAPMMFAFGALLVEASALLRDIAAADQNGISPPEWLSRFPLAGPWLAAHWEHDFAQPGSFAAMLGRLEPARLFNWAQSLGQFMMHHLFIIAFSILVLFFLYEHGDAIIDELRGVLRERLGERASAYLELATRALRASINSMLVVGLFDGAAAWAAYSLASAPHAGVWAAITGALALVPFFGYVAVIALTLQLSVSGAANAALLCFALGTFVLLFGDKVVRPAVAREGTRLPFVWVLMGCLGGFEAFGLVGLVIGPVTLTLAREIWQQRLAQLSPHGQSVAA